MSINQRLNTYLHSIKKNVTNLSKDIGVSQSSLSKVANGENLPSAKILIPLANKGLNINWLLTGIGSMLMHENPSQVNEPLPEYKTTPKIVQDAIKQFYESSENYKESWQKLLHEKDLRLKEKDAHLEEKERIIQTKNKMIELLEAKSQS